MINITEGVGAVCKEPKKREARAGMGQQASGTTKGDSTSKFIKLIHKANRLL